MPLRTSAWRWVWAFGFVLLCVYLAFDVLDLDGSQLRSPGHLLAVSVSEGEAERFARPDADDSAWLSTAVTFGVLLSFSLPARSPRTPRRVLLHRKLISAIRRASAGGADPA